MSSEASKHFWHSASLKSRFKFAGAGWTLALLSSFVGATRRVAPTSGQPLNPESVKRVPGTFFVPGTFLTRVGLTLVFCLLGISLAYAANSPPSVGAITPSSGTSKPDEAVSFTTTYSDQDGWQNISYGYLLVNTSSVAKSKCFYGYYNQNNNKLYLRNDANTGWSVGYAPGSNNIIENNYVKLDCSQTTVSGSGTTLTINWKVTFKPTFTGAKKTYLYVRDDAGTYSGWKQKGTWLINTPPEANSITPSSGSSKPDEAVSFTTTYSDLDGWQNIQHTRLLINSYLNNAKCFNGYYNQNSNKLLLRNDANTGWLGGYTPGSSQTIENSYVKLDCSQTTVSGSGTTLTINWKITFKPTFTCVKKTYLYVRDDAGTYSGWKQKGI